MCSKRKKYTKKPKPTTQPPVSREADPNERLYKMFDDYKNELSELKSIVRGNANGVPLNGPAGNIPFNVPFGTGTAVKPTNDLDIRRQMFQLKFG